MRVDAAACSVDDTDLRTFDGEPVLRVTAAVPGDVPALRERLEAAGVACLEADVRFAYRYLIDRGIRGALRRSTATASRHARLGLRLSQSDARAVPLDADAQGAVDRHRDRSARRARLLDRAAHAGVRAACSSSTSTCFAHAEPVHSERELLRASSPTCDELDPDVITGWNVVDFDLAVLARQAPPATASRFAIGRTEDAFELRREQSLHARVARRSPRPAGARRRSRWCAAPSSACRTTSSRPRRRRCSAAAS